MSSANLRLYTSLPWILTRFSARIFTASIILEISGRQMVILALLAYYRHQFRLARKHHYLLNTNIKLVSSVRIPSMRTVYSAPKRRYFDDVTFGSQENVLISESVYDGRKPTMEHIYDRIFRIRHKTLHTATPSGYSTMTSVPLCKKTYLFWKQCMMAMKFPVIGYREMLSLVQSPSLRNVHSAPLAELSQKRF